MFQLFKLIILRYILRINYFVSWLIAEILLNFYDWKINLIKLLLIQIFIHWLEIEFFIDNARKCEAFLHFLLVLFLQTQTSCILIYYRRQHCLKKVFANILTSCPDFSFLIYFWIGCNQMCNIRNMNMHFPKFLAVFLFNAFNTDRIIHGFCPFVVDCQTILAH